MNIGIYKPAKKIYFYKNEEDHASWSTEIVNISKLLANKGHFVYIMSNTDYDGKIENIFLGIPHNKLDKVFIFNGAWKKKEESEILKMFMAYTTDICYILSDMRLMTNYPEHYRKIFTQSKRLYDYGYIQEHVLIDIVWTHEDWEKTIPYYFGGTERNRTEDFMEYVDRANCEWYGKSETLKIVNYIPHEEHIEKLKHAKTTIIIADVNYNENGFVNDRYYEAAKHDVICFGDSKWDPDELIMRKDDWRRVSSYRDVQEKQSILDNNPKFYLNLLRQQKNRLFGKANGHKIYEAIIS